MDHVASTDQARARIAHTRSMVVSSWIAISFSEHRSNRHAARVERTIDRLARSRIRLSQARRSLARR